MCEQKVLLVIPADGPVRALTCTATCLTVPELNRPETVHVFDGKAGTDSYEPAASNASLIVTTSRSSANFAQTARRSGLREYCIPSYDVDELLRHCEEFGVAPEDVLQRCAELGPSIRYILINDYASCKVNTEAAVACLRTE